MTKKKANYGRVSTAENFTPDEAPPSMAVIKAARDRKRRAASWAVFEVIESKSGAPLVVVDVFLGDDALFPFGQLVLLRKSSPSRPSSSSSAPSWPWLDGWELDSFKIHSKGFRCLDKSDPIFLGAVQAAKDYQADLERLGPELMKKRPGYS